MATRRNAGQVSLRLSLEDGETVRQALKNIGTEGDKALRAIERAGPDASRGLGLVDNAVQSVTGHMEGMAGSAGGAGRVLSAAGPFGLGAAAAVGIAVSLAAATLNAARKISDLRREAERAGQSFEGFQELAFIANRAGVEVDALADGMRELQLRADEFVQTDGGAGKEAFERLGLDRASVNEALQDVDGFFDDVMGRIGELDRAAQIRVLDELFGGTAGEQFTRLLDEGLDSLTAMRQLARDLGAVLSEEVGGEAEELRRSFDEAADILDKQMQQGLANLMPLMTALVNAAASFLRSINGAVEALSGGSIEDRLASLNERIAAAEANEARQIGDLAALPRNLQDATLRGTTRETFLVQIRSELADLREERSRLTNILNARQPAEVIVPPDRPTLPTLPTTGGRTDADRERDRLKRLADAYRLDLAGAVGVYEAAMEQVAELVDANLLTQEEALKVEIGLRETLNATLEKERQARLQAATDPVSGVQRALEAVQTQAMDSASLIEDALTGAFSGMEDAMVEFVQTGKLNFGDLVDSILADIARLLTRQLITGPLSQLLGGAFGFADGGIMTGQGPLPLNAYSTGGIASSPQLALFGEGSQNEAFVPLPDGRSIPVTMQGGGGGGMVELVVRIDDDGGLDAFVEQKAGNVAVRVQRESDRERARQERRKDRLR